MSQAVSSVLLLDDDARVRRALERLDLGPALVMHTCASAAEAERISARVQIDVAVVDQHLAEGDPLGVEVLAHLALRDPDCFRIIFTGDTDLDFAIKALNRGAIDAFLQKPWSDEQTIALLHQGCEAALLRRHNRSLVEELGRRNIELLEFNHRLEHLVTERTRDLRAAHDELKARQADLVRLETQGAVSQLARGLAHELNNPLAAILGYAQRLRRLDGDADHIRRLDVILAEVARCSSLVEQLRNLAAPLNEDILAIDPAEAVQGAAAARDEVHAPCPVIVASVCPPVLAAPRSLRRVIDQILDNAASFGARSVRVEGRSEGERVRVRLINDGEPPSSEAERDAVRPFFTTRAGEGRRGLGLSIASGLMREQGGTLELRARRDAPGAEIHLVLPAAVSAVQAAPASGPVQEGCVLVVDDEPLVAELLLDAIGESGCRCIAVGTMAAAIGAVEEGGVAAVLADRNLPDGDGRDLLRCLVAAAPGLNGRVALITGDDPASLGDEFPVLAKPFQFDQVGALLRRLGAMA